MEHRDSGPAASESPFPRHLHLAPLYRRLVVICLAGLVVVSAALAASMWFQRVWLGLPQRIAVEPFVVCGAIALLLASLLRSRIRVDEDGVARRTPFGWRRHDWSELRNRDLASLCVGESLTRGMDRPARRLYRRLHFLDPADSVPLLRQATPDGARVHFPPTPRRMRVQVFGLKWIELDERGITFEAAEEQNFRPWSELKRAVLRKESHSSLELKHARLEFPDATYPLIPTSVECETEPECRCRRDYLLQRFLSSVLHRDQLLILVSNGPPESVGEAEHRLRSKQEGLSSGRLIARGYCVAVLVLLLIWREFQVEGCFRIAILLISHGVFLGPMYWGLIRQSREDLQMLQTYLTEHGVELSP